LPPRFVADGMLGSLARKLRLYGLDVVYSPDEDDAALLKLAEMDGRVLLTSDRELHARAKGKGLTSIAITARGDVAMTAQVFRELGLSLTLDPSLSRCPVCNGEVVALAKEDAVPLVPPRVYARQSSFYRCATCHRVYWEGGHWFRLAQFDSQVKEALVK
jgi:uncharacterized protein with PIN domain